MVNLRVGVVVLAVAGGGILTIEAVRHHDGSAVRTAVVPLPQTLEVHEGSFVIAPTTCIAVDSLSQSAGELLAQRLRRSTGYDIPVRPVVTGPAQTGTILLTSHRALADLGSEGYALQVTPDGVVIRATSAAGFFYGTQTLLQLLPAEIFSEVVVYRGPWRIPCLEIKDQPRFRWRGLMLDVSRHFFSPAEIKEVLDLMALHKLNTFHWHLTDDQGWRIEIKRYPRLTQVGAWRKSVGFNLDPKATTAYDCDGRYGGYYTQAEIRSIVAYAQARGITIVPEIDMPGHSSASLAAYPEFSCSGVAYTTDMADSVAPGVYCAGNEETFRFLEDILLEVMDLFPGEFIHIGGDEVSRSNWRKCLRCRARMGQEGLLSERELESYFVGRIEKFVNAHVRRLVGWSETQKDDLCPSTILMDWIGGGVKAARSGHDVVMSPIDYCYLDFYQSKDRSSEPAAAGAYLPLEKVYGFEPIPQQLSQAQRQHILGAQANLWTEYVPSLAHAQYMAFPRLTALAEVVWSAKGSRDWHDFSRRLRAQQQRFDVMGVKYRR